MKQRLFGGRRVEVAGLAPEQNVRDEKRRRDDTLAQSLVVVRRHDEPAENGTEAHDREQGGKDAPDPPLVEIDERESPGGHLRRDERSDEVVRYDEKDVDADESAPEHRHMRVKQHHGYDREGTQSVDVAAVLHADFLQTCAVSRLRKGSVATLR